MPGFYNTFTTGLFRHKTGPVEVQPKYFERLKDKKIREQEKGMGFSEMLMKALNGVNDQQMDAYRLSDQFITEPGSVDIHDVTLGIAKANLSLSITKAIFDRAIRAYKELISIR
jgi:flagellar hook-basal body complex protein FliE